MLMNYRIDNLGLLLHDAARLLRRRFEARTAQHGLSTPQWKLLRHIIRSGPCTQSALAEILDVEPISVSRLVDRMESTGWVQREAHPDDRRARLIAPTAKAIAVAPEARAIAETVYAEALVGLSDDQREQFHTALLAVIENLKPEADALLTESVQ